MDQVIETKLHSQLQGEQAEALAAIVNAAQSDQFVSDGKGNVPKGENRTAILLNGTVIGFLSPYEHVLMGDTYHRAGPLFLLPEYRGKGLMREALLAFFQDHTPGLAWIDDTNKPSIKMFVSMGFTRHSPWPAESGGSGHWFTQQPSGSVRPATEQWQDHVPAYLRW